MSKKINLKSMNLADLNAYLVGCKKLADENTRYNAEVAPLRKALDAKKAERAKLENAGINTDNFSILAEQTAVLQAQSTHTENLKPINKEIRKVVGKYVPKEDEMYAHYCNMTMSVAFAKDIMSILSAMGAKVNDPKRGAKQVAHITGWRASKKDGCMKPSSRQSFANMIFLGIATMLVSEGLCERADDGSLVWLRDNKDSLALDNEEKNEVA